MSPFPVSLSTLQYYLYHWVYFPSFFPHPYSLISILILFAVGLALMFKGNYSWNIIFAILGAYFGFIFGHYVTTVVTTVPVPPLLASLVGAVIGAILLIFIVRVILPLGLSYAAYLAVQTVYPGHIAAGGIVFLAVFVIAMVFYRKIVIGIAGVIGAFMVWFSFSSLGVADVAAEILTAMMFALGIFLQVNNKESATRRKKTMQPFDQDSKWD